MTDAEIDGLNGRVLDCAVSNAQSRPIIGWGSVMFIDGPTVHLDDIEESDWNSWQPLIVSKWCENPRELTSHDAGRELLDGIPSRNLEPVDFFHSDVGAAFGLLIGSRMTSVNFGFDTITVSTRDNMLQLRELLSSGPKSEAASIMCRAFLKLKSRDPKP